MDEKTFNTFQVGICAGVVIGVYVALGALAVIELLLTPMPSATYYVGAGSKRRGFATAQEAMAYQDWIMDFDGRDEKAADKP